MYKNTGQYLELSKSMACIAGQELLDRFRKNVLKIEQKKNVNDIVTDADKASERVLLDFIRQHTPQFGVISEESGVSGATNSPWQWVIDPLDGTTNFSAGLPQFSVSIGLEYNGETLTGVVYAPYLNELFYAIKGHGAYLNNQPISVSKKKDLDECVVASGFPYTKASQPDNNVSQAAAIIPLVRGFRRLGSAAMDLCYVAAGYLDAYWEMELNPWDVSAGSLIAREAGATVEYYRSDRNISILAAPRDLVTQLKPLIL